MNLNNKCLGCMEEKGDAITCPKCGWVENTEAESPLQLKPGTILKNQYLIGRVLGQGGFGITYLACDINLRTKLAIKEYFPQGMVTRSISDPLVSIYTGNIKEHFQYGLEKFLEEARTLAKFDDIPEIVNIKDFFKENGTAYLVMNYIEGITLKQYTEQKGGKLPLDLAVNIMLPVIKALEQIHKEGIIHRDISPDNIYITKNFKVKLLDFGAARFVIGELSKSLSVILKPGYAPEEQYRSSGKQGPWTDIYALGATTYKVLTGVTPQEALDRLHKDELHRPSELGVNINRNMEDAIMKALSVKAENRYQNISQFTEDLLREIPKDLEESNLSSDKTALVSELYKENSKENKEQYKHLIPQRIEGEKSPTESTLEEKSPNEQNMELNQVNSANKTGKKNPITSIAKILIAVILVLFLVVNIGVVSTLILALVIFGIYKIVKKIKKKNSKINK